MTVIISAFAVSTILSKNIITILYVEKCAFLTACTDQQ